MLTGDNSILSQAAKAKENTDESTAREEVIMAYNEAMGNNYINGTNSIASDMEEILQKQDGDASVSGDEDYLDAIYKGYEFILENGAVTSSKQDTTETAAVTDAKPGDITTDSDGNAVLGTESDPYQICSIEDLIAFSDIVNAGQITSTDTYVELEQTLNFKSTKSYIDSSRTTLTTTLLDGSTQRHTYSSSIKSDLTSGTGFAPIGGTNGFCGTFDGSGNELKNLYINYVEESETYVGVGLFNYNYGIIQNLTVSGSVTGTMKSTYEATGSTWIVLNVAGITGVNYGTISNCTNLVNVIGIEAGGYGNGILTAGITGYNEGNIIGCTNKGIIKGESNNQTYLYTWLDIAGIASESSGGEIQKCVNTGTISVTSSYEGTVAGIIGYNWGTNIYNCYNTGTLNAKDVADMVEMAGIVGDNGSSSCEIKNCYNIGSITTSNSNGVLKGGIIGYEGYFENVENNYDGANIGAIGGVNLYGKGEYVSLTETEIINYINNGTIPTTPAPTYAISEVLKPGVYVKYDTSSLDDYQIPQTLAGTSNYTASQIVKPSAYTGGWQVLSNDGTTVEIISSDLVTIANSYNSSTQWLYLYGETGYKNAVTTLNTAAKAFLNTDYATSARSTGSTSSSLGEVTDTLKFKPTNYSQLTDMQYYKDFANMCYSGTATATSGNWYWLASRYCYCDSGYCYFYVSSADGPGGWGYGGLFFIYSDGNAGSYGIGYGGLRPIVSLKSELKVLSGTGTSEDPYVLGTN